MTIAERILELEEADRTFTGYKLAERLQELRKGLTLDDLFDHFGDHVLYERALKILGYTVKNGFIRSNEQISQAVDTGAVMLKTKRNRGRDITWIIRNRRVKK